jgi:hypothetical protein
VKKDEELKKAKAENEGNSRVVENLTMQMMQQTE